nr:hypothetical protein [Tanacetum cinerariifolium]
MWRLRIEQYFQVQDYALWDVIENGNSFIPTAQTTTNANGTSTTLIPGLITTKEKVQKKNDVKARSMLLMVLLNEHLMTFNQYKDAKTFFAAIQKNFGGNEATKKSQKNLLKQMYENFSAPSTKSLESIFNRLQKIRNKLDLDTMSFDNLFNNFKIVEQEVKGSASLSLSLSSQNMAFVSSHSSTNDVNTAYGVTTANTQVSTASTQVSPASTQVNTVNLSDATVYAFLVIFTPKLDLSNYGLEEFQQPEFEGYGPKTSNNVSEDICDEVKESLDAPLVKELVLDDKLEKKTIFPTVTKIEFEKGVIDCGCSRHMTRNMSYLSVYKEINGGYVAFGGDPKGGKITGKCKISTDTECVVLSPDFKLLDESQVLLKVLRKNNMYSIDLKNVAPSGGLTNLFSKATLDESNLWHRRLGHINFKTMNKLFCENKGIKREFSVARTPQQNGVAERKNRTPIEAPRTMLADSKTPSLSFTRPFGCPVTILNTLDSLGKFNGKAYEGFFVGYYVNSKAFRVFNSRTMIVEETLLITFLENKPNVARSGPTWLFDIDTLTKSMNYKPVVAENQSNGSACKARVETVPEKDYIVLPLWTQDPLFSSSSKDSPGDGFKPSGEEEKKDTESLGNKDNDPTANVASIKDNAVDKDIVYGCTHDPNMPNLEEIVYSDEDEEVGTEVEMTNLDTNIPCNKESSTKIYKNTTPRKRAYFDAEAKVIHMILSGTGDGIYFTVDACTTTKEM